MSTNLSIQESRGIVSGQLGDLPLAQLTPFTPGNESCGQERPGAQSEGDGGLGSLALIGGALLLARVSGQLSHIAHAKHAALALLAAPPGQDGS